jgi:hypothetical protein
MSALDLTTVANVKAWVGSSASPQWQPNFAFPVGAFIVDAANHIQRVVVPGISGATVPTFSDGGGATTEGSSSPPLQWQDQGLSPDQTIQDCVTAFSLYALRQTGRGNSDGSIPSESPFVTPVSYNEWYDGNGQRKMYVNNWPINSGSLLTINGITVPQSTGITVPGWLLDQSGRAIVLRPGFSSGPATFSNVRALRGREGGGWVFALGTQNINWQYIGGFSGVPFDLEMCARKVVALNYKRTGWIGQKSQSMAAGAGTVEYGTWEMDDDCRATLEYYKRGYH